MFSPIQPAIMATLCLVLCVPPPAAAQRGGGGGGGGFFGGRGGGGAGGGEDFRTRMLQRMDANGNGLVEPNEVPEQARGMFDRIAQGAGVAPGQPIPINGSGPPSGDTPSKPDTSKKSADDLYPRIPKFGDTGVRGFGVSPETLNGKLVDLEKKYDRRILESVNRTLERYDKNKTGLLEHDEWVTVSWRSDPRESDLDKDGLLTKAELAERYRKGLIDEDEGDNRARGGARGGDRRGNSGGNEAGPGAGGPFGGRAGGEGGRRGGGGGFPGGGFPGSEDEGGGRRRGRGFDPASMLANLDRNGNGLIEPDEVDERMKGFASQMGIQFDRPVPLDEITKAISGGRRNRGEAEPNGDANKDKASEKKKATEPPPPVMGYRVAGQEKLQGRKSFRSGQAALPKLMPDWWEARDKDKDGQIGLDEFDANITDSSIKEFNKFDRNRDGLITAQEAGSVTARGKK